MAIESAPPLPCPSSIDPYEKLKIVYYSENDSLTRLFPIPCTNATCDDNPGQEHVLTKDIPLEKTSLRLFLPVKPPLNGKLLPLVIYLHGGGFILCSAENTVFHDFCVLMATTLPAVIVSVDYRLAPENRLPAAYDDAVEAIKWVQNQALDVDGGHKWTESEVRLVNNETLPLSVCDLMWDLSLPRGVDRDHEYCNPVVNGDARKGEKIGLLGRCFVSVRGRDILMDHQIEFVRMLEGRGVSVVCWFDEIGYHGIELFDRNKAEALIVVLKDFVSSSRVTRE
ncbi:hypothetical protein GIB67_023455 [Kingdonia uniflora]|uniref:Alpha/beta hydrolase fold-3 domain-containing protein n=1 Tax=Kingdonia uniflora TaxID=39325 RepID=A0A7J7PAJ6_9MAGN|nr:hypothetical protein GIB67_023455 [Kingdonia uniflora]